YRHLVVLEIAIAELHRALAKYAEDIVVQVRVAGDDDVRHALQILRELLATDAGARLDLVERQSAQAFELRHQLDALRQRAARERLQNFRTRAAAQLRQMRVENHPAADRERR